MIERRQADASLYVMELGDGTHYEFLIAHRPGSKYLLIASVGSVEFGGYEYEIDELRRFAAQHPRTMAADREDYRWAACEEVSLEHPLLGYMMAPGHSGPNVNPWTALAACRAAAEYLKTGSAWTR